MKEASDPKADGFMRVEEVVQALASGYGMQRDDCDVRVVRSAGKVRSDTLQRLIDEGWLEGYANGGGWRLSDEGHKAYLRSSDEMGDGKLVAPRTITEPT